jgi:hypothetical protein
MAQLYLHDREIKTAFDLLGSDENDITFSLGWGLAQSDVFRARFFKDVFPQHDAGEVTSVHLQKHGNKHGGYTDIEIETATTHLIVEAKRWWNLPTEAQLKKYVPRFTKGKRSAIVVMAECERNLGKWKLPPKVKTTPVIYRSWQQVAQLLLQSAGYGNHAEKRLLRELVTYLKGLIDMQNHESNWVYVIALDNKEIQPWSGMTWCRHVIENKVFHQSIDEHWPKEPPNYLGFRYDRKLQSIHHAEKYEIVTDLYNHARVRKREGWMKEPRHFCRLGQGIIPSRTVKTTGLWNTRVWAALDLLLRSKTVSAARDKTNKRVED